MAGIGDIDKRHRIYCHAYSGDAAMLLATWNLMKTCYLMSDNDDINDGGESLSQERRRPSLQRTRILLRA